MPRRRMTDPFFWSDHKVGRLSRDERSLVAGCMGHSDDKGRIEANPAYLKAMIFKYDDDLDNTAVKDLRDSCLKKMQSWPTTHPYRMVLYSNADEEYIFFPAFNATNKPSHPTESQLPPPPLESLPIFSREEHEPLPTSAGNTPSQVRSGQSSLGKVREGQGRGVQEDFTKFLDSEKDLTDFLTQTLEIYAGRGAVWLLEVLKKLWQQAIGEPMKQPVFELTLNAVKKYPIPVLARAYVKAVKYKGGKYSSYKYIEKILEEQAEKESDKKGRSP